MNKQWNHKTPSEYGNYQDIDNCEDAHDLFESTRVVLAAERLFLASELNRTRGKRLANRKSTGNQTKNEKHFE
jgi:hypothetical protein